MGRFMKPAMSLLFVLSLISCAPKKVEEEAASTTPTTDGSQTAAQLAGSGVYCGVFGGSDGSSLSGLGYTRSLTLTAGGAFSYSVYFSDATGCSSNLGPGGNNIATYSQSGTYVVGGTAGTPSTGTKITFTVTSATMTAYPSNATAQSLRDFFNSNCNMSPTFTTGTTTSTRTFTGVTCTATSAYGLGLVPASSAQLYNIGYNDGSGSFVMGSRSDIFGPGAGYFPTSYSETWLSW
jgi:hypothetical protein